MDFSHNEGVDKVKIKEIKVWLHDILDKEERIPLVKLTPSTIDQLYNLMKANQKAETNACIYEDFLKHMQLEYKTSGSKLSTTLEKAGVGTLVSSKECSRTVNELADVAAQLDLSQLADSNYLLAITSQKMAVQDTLQTRKKLECDLQAITKQRQACLQGLSKLITAEQGLKRDPEKIESEIEAKTKDALFLHSKCKKYKSEIEAFERKLRNAHMEPGLTHEAICERASALKEIMDKLRPVKDKLLKYEQLPPDATLAKVKIAEAKTELDKLEGDLAKYITLLHM